MDEIVESFENTMGSIRAEETSFKDFYKNWGRFGNQEERRNELLKRQKSNRETRVDRCRGIFALIETANLMFDEQRSLQTTYTPNVYVPGFTKGFNQYSNVLMLSEWFVEKPEDFAENWLMIPCPKGTRTLVVASNGSTRCFSKYGQIYYTSSTMLPGGSFDQSRRSCSVLDGFFCKNIKTMYVLDVLTWNNHVMADGEMEFRNFWLTSKFNEIPELGTFTTRNKIVLKLLPTIPCDVESLNKFLMQYPPSSINMLDGLLFYHKRGYYASGETPLVGWLYPFMLPEVLSNDITMHEMYAAEKPENYVDQATYIEEFEEKLKQKRTSNKKGNKISLNSKSNMDTEDAPEEQTDSMQVSEPAASVTDPVEELETENATCPECNNYYMEPN